MVFLSKRLVRWVLMALAVPVTVWATDALAERLEGSRGASRLTRVLQLPGRWRRGEILFAD
jgi:hypothetical protein